MQKLYPDNFFYTMRANLLFTLIALLFCSYVHAREFHFPAVYDACGPVKEIKTDSENPLVKKKVKFDKHGRGGIAMMKYNDAGYPEGFELNALGKLNFQKYFWNKDCRLDSVAVKFHVIGKAELITVKNAYSDKNLESQIIRISDDNGQLEFRMTFKDYSYDDQGNWIFRTVSRTTVAPDGKVSESQFDETRSIKYYDIDKAK